MSASSIMAGAAFVKLTLDDADLKRGVNAAQGQIKGLCNSIQAFSNKTLMISALISPPIIMATKVFADFDDQMRLTAAVTGASGEKFESLTELAKKLGRETSFTAAQVAAGMVALGRMGFSSDQIEAAIKPMMDLSRTTGTDLAMAAQIAANNLSVFQMGAEKSAEAADILSVTANGSAQDLNDLGEALKMAGPHAARAGASLKDTAAMLGVLANMGIRGSLAGTALGKSFKRIADPAIVNFLHTCGIEVKNLATGDMRNLKDILVDIAKYMKTLNGMEQINFAEHVFDARGSLGGGTLSVNTEQIDIMLAKLANCDGVTARAAADMESGLGGTLRRLASAAEGISIALGEIIGKTFGPLIESASQFCTVLAGMMKDSAVVSSALSYIGTITSFAVLIKTVSGVWGAIKSLASPLLFLDNLVTRTSAKAFAAAEAEKVRQAATATRVTAEIAAEKQKTAAVLAEAAKQKEAEAANAIAKLQASKAQKTANNLLIAESQQIIAAKKAETAAIVAAEQKVIALQQGKKGRGAIQAVQLAQAKIQIVQAECAETVTAEMAKQASIEKTNMVLMDQISVQEGVAAAASKNAATSASSAAAAAQEYNTAAKAAEAAAASEAMLMTSQKKATANTLIRAAAQGKLTTAKLFGVATDVKYASAVMATSVTEMVAARKSAAASAIKVAGYYAEAAAAKIAAGATIAFSRACSVLIAHPIMAALAALAVAFLVVKTAVSRANATLKKNAEMAKDAAQAAKEARESGDQKRKTAPMDFERLKQLEEISSRGKLSAEEMAEAEKLINTLDPFGSGNWAKLDNATGQLSLAADAQKRFNDEMRDSAKIQLESEIAKQELAIEKLRATLSDSMWRNVGSWFGGNDTDEHNDPIHKEIDAEVKNLIALRKRLQALKKGENSAVTGEEGQTSQDRIRQTAEARRASVEELKNAENELARMDEENAKKKMTKLEQEIYQIDKLKARYLELAELKKKDLQAEMRAAEKRMAENQAGKTPEQKKAYQAAYEKHQKAKLELDELDNRTKAAVTHYDQQRKEAHKRDEDSQKRYTGFLPDHENKIQQRERDDKQEKEFNQLVQNRTPEGKNALKEFMDQLSGNLEAAKQRYQQMLEKYQDKSSEGGSDLSSAERAELDNLQREITAGADRLRGYQNRIGDGVQQAQSNHRTMASFDASALMGLFDKTGMAKISQEERIAKATEETAKNTKKMAQTKSAAAATVEVG